MIAPTIVLGLGGVGSEIVARLERMVEAKGLKCKALFAAIDTDVNTMNRIRQEGFGGSIIQISQNMTVKEYLGNHKEYAEWFFATEGLNVKSMTEGAGQVRAISRLAFDMAVRNGALNELGEKINQLFQISERTSIQAPRILIVSSLAGGTGSGIVLPLALYMRRYFAEVLHNNSVIIKGMFIMPDVFQDIIGNDFEQVSIEANAYAAIKELDAFIKKGEGYLPKRYNSKLHLKLPTKITGNSEEYVVLPYNYCYLFGGKNKYGNRLGNFQDYLDFTVKCIYAQSFSPMQELNNSIEDNVFRIAATGAGGKSKEGFQRFCSAGTAILTYPYELIREMLALRKAGTILSEQWLQIDRAYTNEVQKNEELRRQGKYVKNRWRSSFYMEYVDGQKESNPFIKKIYQDTTQVKNSDDNMMIRTPSWEAYWEALEKNVAEWNSSNDRLNQDKKVCIQSIEGMRTQRYRRVKRELISLKDRFMELYERYTAELDKKKSIIKPRFFSARLEEENDETYYMSWLRQKENFIHPNAIRYFLYKTLEMFHVKKEELKQMIEQETRELNSCSERTSDKLRVTERGILNDLFYREEFRQTYEKVERGIGILEQYANHVLLEHIAAKGIEFFERLAKEYEAFYDVFEYNIEQYMERADAIKRQLENVDGTIMRYVGCDDKTIQYMENAVMDISADVEAEGKVSEVIFKLIYANINGMEEEEDYHIIFQDHLIEHWKKELENYGHILDMDILEALEREKICNLGREGTSEAYIIHRIDEMWEIASPFVSMNDRQMELTKNFCTYSTLLEQKKDQSRNNIMNTLKNGGGTTDVEGAVDKYTILFYQVVYGLSPGGLKDMEIVWDTGSKKYRMGNISTSYYQMLENTKFSRMTPHIDWNWNRFDILPDFNSSYQMYLEDMTYQTFLYQCVEHLNIERNNVNTPKYCMDIDENTIYTDTLHKMLIDEFINNLSFVKSSYVGLNQSLLDWIQQGREYADFPFIKDIEKCGTDIGGILGLIYCVNTDGGINEYDSIMARNMVYAFVNLLRRIITQFDMTEGVKIKVREMAKNAREAFVASKTAGNAIVNRDILFALDNKLREIT